jgi:hypothetical protein
LAGIEDMKSFMPQEAVEACIASAQRIALAILTQPKSLRAECLATARRSLEESAVRLTQGTGGERAIKMARTWAALQMQGVEALIKEIEASGGARGGHA